MESALEGRADFLQPEMLILGRQGGVKELTADASKHFSKVVHAYISAYSLPSLGKPAWKKVN